MEISKAKYCVNFAEVKMLALLIDFSDARVIGPQSCFLLMIGVNFVGREEHMSSPEKKLKRNTNFSSRITYHRQHENYSS